MMNGIEFITATDGKAFYIESFLKCIIYGYGKLISSSKTYSRIEIHETIKRVQNSVKAHNEIEDFLCTDLINNFVKPNLGLFGLESLVVDVGVRETKENVTVGHLDVKFHVPSLSNDDYYAFEAKRLDKNSARQKYYIDGGIARFTKRVYYPETNTIVAGMIGFVEIDFSKSPKGRVTIDVIKDSVNNLISAHTEITTTQLLNPFVLDADPLIESEHCKYIYLSKHTRDDDKEELKIYHVMLDYYDTLIN
jgi:hypothetical protein